MDSGDARMEVEHSRKHVDELYSDDPAVCLVAAQELKFQVVGSVKAKKNLVEQGVVARLLQIFKAPDSSVELKTEVVVILNSVAMGEVSQALALVQAGLIPILWDQLEAGAKCEKFTTRILCCLRSIYKQGCVPPPPAWNSQVLSTLIQYGYSPVDNQECVANILAHACKTKEQQEELVEAGAGELVAAMLSSRFEKVQKPALFCLASLCYQNEGVAKRLTTLAVGSKDIPTLTVELLARDMPTEMQLAAATCLVFFHRAGAIKETDQKINIKALQCLVRLCKKDNPIVERVEAAHQLAYLTEISVELQVIASITDHLPSILLEYLKFDSSDTKKSDIPKTQWPLCERDYADPKRWPQLMKIAAFQAFTSITANDEAIRKVVIELDGLMNCLVVILHKGSMDEQMAGVRCLHSLSRSVQTLRTGFQDHVIWKPLVVIIKESTNEEFITVACSSLCNLLLEFSPSKEYILDHGAIEILCALTRRHRPSLRLNTVWALMNMAFQADVKIKTSIIQQLGTDQIFNLLADCDVNVIMKTLGLLRNLLSTTAHIDLIMNSHGKEIMQGIIMVLESQHCADVKEQALCILTNIADGIESKSAIMSNDDILSKLTNYLHMPTVKLQIAATYCISNLVTVQPGMEALAAERQEKMRKNGIHKILENLLSTTDPNLYDKVKTALDQFRTNVSFQ